MCLRNHKGNKLEYVIPGRQQNERATFQVQTKPNHSGLCFYSFYCSHRSAASIAARSTSEVRAHVRISWAPQGSTGKAAGSRESVLTR